MSTPHLLPTYSPPSPHPLETPPTPHPTGDKRGGELEWRQFGEERRAFAELLATLGGCRACSKAD
eukprot:745367-Prymnesium_polylepis.1